MRPHEHLQGGSHRMGHNAAIRRFDAKKAGQPLDLFQGASRLPVVLELLATPWLQRGSQLDGPRRVEVEVPVEWDGERGRPLAFVWKQKRYAVDALVQQWAVDALWWDRPRARSRRCFRVIARGGVYDLAYDRIGERWLLVGVVD
jgi:hypothetical protein